MFVPRSNYNYILRDLTSSSNLPMMGMEDSPSAYSISQLQARAYLRRCIQNICFYVFEAGYFAVNNATMHATQKETCKMP